MRIGLFLTMVAAPVVVLSLFGDNRVLVLESIEVVLFACFWAVQTWEHWDPPVTTAASP